MADGEELVEQVWSAVTGGSRPRPALAAMGASGLLPSSLATEDVALACVSAALLTAAELRARRVGRPVAATVHRGHVAEAVRSERRFTVGGRPAGMGFGPLSAFWPAADGWVRTHDHYPWHRAALLAALGVPEGGDDAETRELVAAAIGDLPAGQLEERVFARGGVAVRVRSDREWLAGAQGQALAQEDLVGHRVLPGAPPRRREPDLAVAGGIRVLDLTRVIAGPVCTRYLGALGASVLRLDRPAHLDVPRGQVADTLLGKRTAELDLMKPTGPDLLHELLDSADVLVCGYRPGSLDRFGLTDDELAARHPGLVVVRLAAWGHTGPWSRRRGFDSLVQAAVGISLAEADGDRPGALPCQLLDHGTGYLAAAAALDGLHRQETEGGTHIRTLSLARTARWLLDTPRPTPSPPVAAGEWLTPLNSAHGKISAVAPPGRLDGEPVRWPDPASGYLDDDPAWPTSNR